MLNFGKIENIEIEGKKCIIEFLSPDFLFMHDMLVIIYHNEPRYFVIEKIRTSGALLSVTAEEIGYYNKLSKVKDLDIRHLLGLEIDKVTDLSIIKKVNEESRFC